jgi:hypothetical protein
MKKNAAPKLTLSKETLKALAVRTGVQTGLGAPMLAPTKSCLTCPNV